MKGVLLSPAMRRALIAAADKPILADADRPLNPTLLALERRDFVSWRFVGHDIEWTPTAAGLRAIGREPVPVGVEMEQF